MFMNDIRTYGSVAKLLHWLIALLVLIMIVVGFSMGLITDRELRGTVINIHKLTGLTIFALVLLRLIWTMINIKPALPADTPVWQRVAERLVHGLLYVALLVMPLSGFIGSVAGGKPPHVGNAVITVPLAPNKSLAGFAFEWIHNQVIWVLIGLLVIHIGAALYHELIKKDDVLRRML